MLTNLLAPGALLRRLLSTLVNKIRHGLLLVTRLILTDFSLLLHSVKGIHGALALGSSPSPE
eukprot:314361-Pelagomonas_calceolata.AAC.1